MQAVRRTVSILFVFTAFIWAQKPMKVLAYSPYRNGQAPGAAYPTEAQIREDLALLAPLTEGIRVYGTDGTQALIPGICDELGIDVIMSAWIDGQPYDGDNAQALIDIINEGHSSIKLGIVGNEVLLRARNAAQNGMSEAKLLTYILQVREGTAGSGVPITFADTFDDWFSAGQALQDASDVVLFQSHPWWHGQNAATADDWAFEDWYKIKAKYPNKPIRLAETGWPTQVNRMSDDGLQQAVGSPDNQAAYFVNMLHRALAEGLEVWMFSAFDEKWKESEGEGFVGGSWGIFYADRSPKPVINMMLESAVRRGITVRPDVFIRTESSGLTGWVDVLGRAPGLRIENGRLTAVPGMYLSGRP